MKSSQRRVVPLNVSHVLFDLPRPVDGRALPFFGTLLTWPCVFWHFSCTPTFRSVSCAVRASGPEARRLPLPHAARCLRSEADHQRAGVVARLALFHDATPVFPCPPPRHNHIGNRPRAPWRPRAVCTCPSHAAILHPSTSDRITMAPPPVTTRPPVKCYYCCSTFGTTANVARHVQTMHKHESQLVGAGPVGSSAQLVFGSFSAGTSPAPPLLEPDVGAALPAAAEVAHALEDNGAERGFPPALARDSEDERDFADLGSTDAAGARCTTAAETLVVPRARPDDPDVERAVDNDEDVPLFGSDMEEDWAAPLLFRDSDGDHDVPPLLSGSSDDDYIPPLGPDSEDDDNTPPLMSDENEQESIPPLISGSDGEYVGLMGVLGNALHDNGNGANRSSASVSEGSVGAAEYADFGDVDGMLSAGGDNGTSSLAAAQMPRHVFVSSTASRYRAYFERFPETSLSTPVVDRLWADRPTRFNSPALRGALLFALTAGASGMTERDQVRYARSLRAVEAKATRGTERRGPVTSTFGSAHSFLTATRHEMNRVLAVRNWMQVPVTVGGRTFQYYYRDVLQAGLDAMAAAKKISFRPNEVAAPSSGPEDQPVEDPDIAALLHRVDLDGDDVGRVRRGTLDSDLYLLDDRKVREVHGATARVLGVHLHADEAMVSWSGANYMFPVRAKFVNIVDGGGRWETVGYVEHVSKPTEKTAAARLAVSDTRNELFHRCISVSLRRLVYASESGVSVTVAGRGVVLVVPRVVGLVVDQVEERSFLGLMGNQCNYFCSPCMESKRASGSLLGIAAVEREVTATLDAQLAAAVVRANDPRPSLHRELGRQHSALAFAPALGAMHGLSTGCHNLYRIVTFDVLHVWKLGILRDLAQRLPGALSVLCASDDARLGSVASTLDAINLRMNHLGRNCKATPSPPG